MRHYNSDIGNIGLLYLSSKNICGVGNMRLALADGSGGADAAVSGCPRGEVVSAGQTDISFNGVGPDYS